MSDKQKTSNLLGSTLLVSSLLAIWVAERILVEGSSYTAVLGLAGLALATAFALRVKGFVRATGDVRAVEARLLGSYAGVLAAIVLYALSSDACVAKLGLEGDAKTRFVGVLSVLWPATLVVSAAAMFFIELVYARMPIAASVELRRVRTALYAGLSLGFASVFVLSLNYVVSARDIRKDVSYFKTTHPSAGTERLLAKLTAPVKVSLFFRKNDDVLAQLEPYFATLQAHSKNIQYRVVDAALVPELARKHHISGNGSVLLVTGEGDKAKGQSFRVGTELTEARAQLKKLDSLFQQSFTKLARPERRVLLTVGHAERNSKAEDLAKGDGTQLLNEIWKRLNLKTDTFGLSQGLGNAVPDGSSAVIITGPREKLMPEEVATLLAYVRGGGRLLVMLDPGVDDGLDPLLAGLGLERMPGVLESEKQHMRHANDASDKALVFSSSYSSHPIVSTASRYQSEVATVFVQGVGLRKAATDKLVPKPNVTFALRSSPSFYRDLDASFAREPAEPLETINMIAAVTVTAKPGATEGRAVVIGDGDFMTDKVASNNGNMMVFVDSLSWLIGNEELAAEVSSEEDVKIEHSRDQDKAWFYATTFAMPMPVLGLGLWIARRRRRSAEARP